jgi:hypothetical protein
MKRLRKLLWTTEAVLSLGFLTVSAAPSNSPVLHTFQIGQNEFLLDDHHFQIRCGEVHVPRVPRSLEAAKRHLTEVADASRITACSW